MLISINRVRSVSFAVITAAAITLLLPGCGGGSSDPHTHLRYINTVYGSQAEVYCNSQELNLDGNPQLAFGSATFYNNVAEGTDTLKFLLSAIPNVTFPTLSEPMTNGAYYTDFIFGRSDVANTSTEYPIQRWTGDDHSSPGTGNARMRVIDAAPDAGAVDVIRNGTSLISNIGYQYLGTMNEFGAGTQSIVVNLTGTSNSIASQTVTLNAGQFYTLVILESSPPGGAVSYSIMILNDSQS